MPKITIKLRSKIPSMGSTNEYLLNVWFENNGVIYFLNSCVWNSYAASFEEAKEQLKTQPDFCNIIDHLIDGIIIKHNCFPAAEVKN